MRLIFFLQFDPENIRCHTKNFSRSIPFLYQSFPLPLPRLKKYLVRLADNDFSLAWSAMQKLQTQSLQGQAATKTMRHLLTSRQGLCYTSLTTQLTNLDTLFSFCQAGKPTQAILVLYPEKNKKVDGSHIELYVYLLNRKHQLALKRLQTMQSGTLAHRIQSAFDLLDQAGDIAGKTAYHDFLQGLRVLAEANDFQALSHAVPSWQSSLETPPVWLQTGFDLLTMLQAHCRQLVDYPVSGSTELRRTRIQQYQASLSDLPMPESAFWHGIATELIQSWHTIYQREMDTVRDWLLLTPSLVMDSVAPGTSHLTLQIHNPGRVAAEHLTIRLLTNPALTWQSMKHQLSGVVDLNETRTVTLPVALQANGQTTVDGTLQAQDVYGRDYQWPFNLPVWINAQGQPYRRIRETCYKAGTRLTREDNLFVGRTDLLDRLATLWRVPQEKAAILLIGLRRMGKSSVLERIRHAGLGKHLIPIYLDLQGCADAWHVYSELISEICRRLDQPPPVPLPTEHTSHAVNQFLQHIQPELAGRYLLIMLDEANFLADTARYGNLQHHLRSLMQAAEQPVLLLFCGTYALRTGASDYQSILFNTCYTEYVSYMPETEAYEVLTRPVAGKLTFDPQALALGFQLTAGQPFLLQQLGDRLIRQFNGTLKRGEPRSDYVTYQDMAQAGRTLAEQDNAAFAHYWEEATPVMQLTLSVLAEALDEVSRRAISVTGVLHSAEQSGLSLPRAAVAAGLYDYAQQELFSNSRCDRNPQ